MAILMDRAEDPLIGKIFSKKILLKELKNGYVSLSGGSSTCLLIWRRNVAVDEVRKKTTGLVLEILKENMSVSEGPTYFGDKGFKSV